MYSVWLSFVSLDNTQQSVATQPQLDQPESKQYDAIERRKMM